MSGFSFSHEPKQVDFIDTKYRKIVTKIPVPESIPIIEKAYTMESSSMHGQLPVIWDRAEGFQVFDPWGNCWIDFTSTIFVANAGHSNKRILKAIHQTLEKPLLHTYTYFNPERLDYLDLLIEKLLISFKRLSFYLRAQKQPSVH